MSWRNAGARQSSASSPASPHSNCSDDRVDAMAALGMPTPSSSLTREGRRRMVGRFTGAGYTSTLPGTTEPAAYSRSISAAVSTDHTSACSGSTPRSNRYDDSVESPRRFEVVRMPDGLKYAHSRKTSVVESEISEPAPPMVPASATGLSPSQMSRSLDERERAVWSSVVNETAAPALRTMILWPAIAA